MVGFLVSVVKETRFHGRKSKIPRLLSPGLLFDALRCFHSSVKGVIRACFPVMTSVF